MEVSMVYVVSVLGILGLAGVLLVAAARRKEVKDVLGVLARETRRQDTRPATRERREGKPTTAGYEIERASTRRRAEVVPPESRAPTAWVPPDPDSLGATRRQFLNRSITGFFAIGLSGFAAASVAFLWPTVGGGFGSAIRVGNLNDLVQEIRDNGGFLYVPEGRMWLTEYPPSALDKARSVYSAPELTGMEAGVIALYQKCPHLGCRVPECVTSQWFECPCHGSQYNRVGEKKGGPAPRGMDRFPMSVAGATLTVDTGTIILGPPIGTNTTGQEAEGPHCIGSTESHA